MSKVVILAFSIFLTPCISLAAVYGDINNYSVEVNANDVFIRGGSLSGGNIGSCNSPGYLILCSHSEPECKAKTSVALTAFTSGKKLWLYFGSLESCPTQQYQKIGNVQIHN